MPKKTALTIDLRDDAENVAQHVHRSLRRIDEMDELRSVEFEDGLGFALVRLQAALDDGEIGVVETILAKIAWGAAA